MPHTIDDVVGAFGSRRGDVRYDPELDLTGNGYINSSDILAAARAGWPPHPPARQNSIDLIINQANGRHEITLWDGAGGVAGYDWQFQGITSHNRALPSQPNVNGWYQVHRDKSQWNLRPLDVRVHCKPMHVYNLIDGIWRLKGSGLPSWHQITNIQGWGDYSDDDFRSESDGFSIGCPPPQRSLHGAIGALSVTPVTTGSYTQMEAWLEGPDADRAVLGMSAGGDWRGAGIDQIGMSQVIRLGRTLRPVAMLHTAQTEAQLRSNPPPL